MTRSQFLILSVLSLPSGLMAQEAEPLLEDIQPASLTPIATLDFAEASASPGIEVRVFPFREGWAVTSATYPGEVMLFGSDGAWIRGVGRLGEGPGEFQGIIHVLETQDGAAVFVDPRARRMSWLSPSLEFETSAPIPGNVFMARRAEDGTIVAGGQFSDDGETQTVALFRDGQFRLVAPSRSHSPRADFSAVMPIRGAVWATKISGGIVEIVDIESGSVREVRSIGLEGYDVIAEGRLDRDQPPPNQVMDAVSDGTQFGMIVAAVADAAWTREARDPEGLFDTEVLIIDLNRQAIVARARHPRICTSAEFAVLACPTDLGDVELFRVTW